MILANYFCDYSGQTTITTIQQLCISLLEWVGELLAPTSSSLHVHMIDVNPLDVHITEF